MGAAGRALIGISVGSRLMVGFKASFLWWPEDEMPLAKGALLPLGALGTLAATAPLESVAGVAGWRIPSIFLAVATLAVAAWIWLVVTANPHARRTAGRSSRC